MQINSINYYPSIEGVILIIQLDLSNDGSMAEMI